MAHRTQITLTDAQYERLQRESERTGSSLSELIRRAVDATYRGMTREERLRALDESFGIWKDRTDIPATGAEYVEELRPGMAARLKKLGLDPDR